MQTTDNQEEVFDVVDGNDKVVGKATRREVHSDKKLMHRSIGVVLFNGRHDIFLQRRSITKDTDALSWTISCSGHVRSGDSYDETAKRELEEELGVKGVVLSLLTKYFYSGQSETEVVQLYTVNYRGEIKLQNEEILEGRFFSKDNLITAVATKEIDLNMWGRQALEKLGFISIK